MMDAGKLKSLAHWVNCVGVGPCVESLQQLQDGSHFIGIIKIINGDRGTQFCELPMQRFRLICSFLEDFYGISLQHHVDHTKILQRADVDELAKVTALLLCASVQGPKVDFFVDMITKLDMAVQTHLKEIIEVVVARGSGGVLQTNFASILYKKLNEEVCTSSPVEPITPLIPGSKAAGCFGYSPVKALFNTPNMVSKMRDRKSFYEKIRKLEIDIANEKAMRSDREQEIIEKNAAIGEKEAKVNELKQQVANLRKLCADVDSMRSASDQLKVTQARVERLKRRLAELESMRSANSHLERQVQNLLDVNADLEDKVHNLTSLRMEHDRQRAQLAESKQRLQELQDTECQRKKELQLMATTNEEAQAMLTQQRELTAEHQQKIRELEEQQIAGGSSGESLNIIPERRLGEVLDQLNQSKDEMKRMEESFQASKVEYQKTLITQVNKAREEGNKRYVELENAATSKLNSLQNELHIQRENNSASNRKIHEFSQLIHSLSNSEKILRQEVLDAHTQAQQQGETITSLETGRKKLEVEARSTEEKHQQQVQQLQAAIEELKCTEGKLVTEIAAAKRIASQQQEVIASQESASKTQEDALESARKQLKHSFETIHQSQQTVESLKKQIQRYVEENATAEQTVQELISRMNTLKDAEKTLIQEGLDARALAQRRGETIANLENSKLMLEEDARTSLEQSEQQAVRIQELQAVIKGLKSVEERLAKEGVDAHSEAQHHAETVVSLEAANLKLEEDAKSSAEQYEHQAQELNAVIKNLRSSEAKLIQNLSNARLDVHHQTESLVSLQAEKIKLEEDAKSSAEQDEQRAQELNAVIQNLRSTEESLTKEVFEARSDVQRHSETIASLEAAKLKVEEDAKSLSDQYDKQSTTVLELQSMIQSLRCTGERLNKEVSDVCTEAQHHAETIVSLQAAKMSLEEDVKTVSRKYEEQSTTVRELQAAKAKLTEELLAAKQVSSQQQDVITNLERTSKRQADEVESTRQQLKQSFQTIQQSQQTVESLRKTSMGLKNSEGNLTQEVSSARLYAQHQEAVISSLEQSKKSMEEELASTQKQVQNYLETNAAAEQKIQEFKTRVNSLCDAEKRLKQEVLDTHTKAQYHVETIVSLETAKTKLEQDVESVARQFEQLQETIRGLRSTEESLTSEVSKGREVASKQQEVVTNLENAINTQADELESTKIQLLQSFETIQSLQDTNTALKNSEGNLSQEVSAVRRHTQQQQEIITGLKASKKNLEEELASSTRKQVQQNLEMDADAEQKMQEFRQRIDALINNEVVLKQEILDAHTQNQHKEETFANLGATNMKLREEVKRLANQCERQAAVNQELQTTIKGLRSTEERLTTEVSNRVSSQQEVIASLENTTKMQAAELESTREQLKGRVMQLQINAETNQKMVSDLQLELENHKRLHQEDSVALKREIASKTEQLASVEAQMRFEKDSNLKELQIVQEELDHTKRLLEAGRGSVPPPIAEPLLADMSMHSVDSLDDGELNLAELEAGSRASVASNSSTVSGRSTGSSKSQCTFTIELHSRQSICSNSSLSTAESTPTQQSTYRDSLTTGQLTASQNSLASSSQLHLSTASHMSDTLNLSHLGALSLSRASNSTLADNLPDQVSQTIDELSTDHFKTRSLRASMRQSKISRRTTGRAGFCLVGACEEEPEAFDWDRLAELQRRNTLCRPHLQTSYPVETQTRAPQDITEDGLKVGATSEETGEGPVTRGASKRKSGDQDLPKSSVPAKIRTSNSHHTMPPPPPPVAKRSVQNIKTVATVGPRNTSRQSKNAVGKHNTSTSSVNSATSSTSSTSSGNRFHRSGILRASSKSNKTQKTVQAKAPAIKALQESENRRESLAFNIGFSPKPQLKRRHNRASVAKKATNSPKVQAATPGTTPNKKSKRRSIAKWLGK